MAKRRNIHGQARKEEMEMLEDVEEEAGVFQRASQDKLKGRRIVKARRPRTSARSSPVQQRPSSTNQNPFAGFQVSAHVLDYA